MQVEILGQLLPFAVGQPDPHLDRHVTDAETGGDAQPVGAVDDIAVLIDHDGDDDRAALLDVGLEGREVGIGQRWQQVGIGQMKDPAADGDGGKVARGRFRRR